MPQTPVSLPDTDDVPHFVQYDSLERAVRFQVENIIDVESHIPFGADSVACVPHTLRSRRTKYSSDTIDLFQSSANQEPASRESRGSSARDMGDNLGPPSQTNT